MNTIIGKLQTEKKDAACVTQLCALKRGGLLQGQCADGEKTASGGEYAKCREKALRRKARDSRLGTRSESSVPPIEQKAVQDAFKNNTQLPAEFQITPQNVATKPWKERPVTSYMADNPGNDFAEAIMAYVNEPQRLKAFSPTRFDFIDKRKARWLASGQPKVNIWEQVKQGGPARTLKPSRPRIIWERVREAN